MDIVYPLNNRSKSRDDFELRISLRSLELQPWTEKVILVGYKPSWIENVIHIPCPDPYQAKDANIINKILRVCIWEELSEDFIVNSDDQIFLKEIDHITPMVENAPMEINYKVKAGTNNWYRRVQDTISWCQKNGYQSNVFQSHCPYVVNKVKYPIIMTQIPWGRGNSFVTHVYFNILNENYQQEPKGRTIRIKQPTNNIDKLIKDNSLFMNFNNSGLNEDLKKWLLNRFPKKSRWEK